MSNLDADGVENTPLNQILIQDLVETQPLDNDSEGRLPSILVIIKNALHNTFPNIGNSQINTRAKEFNNVVSSLQPSCGIIYWVDHHDVTKLGKGWSFCDGSSHTLSNGRSVTTPKIDSMFLHDINDKKVLDSNNLPVHSQTDTSLTTGDSITTTKTYGFSLEEKHVEKHHHNLTSSVAYITQVTSGYAGTGDSGNKYRNPWDPSKLTIPSDPSGLNKPHKHNCSFNNKPDHVILNPITYIGY